MVISLSALAATLGVVGLFFVALPLLAHGLIGLAVAQTLSERAENQAYKNGTSTTVDEAL